MDLPKRKAMRLPEYDYSAPGAYFVTVCTHGWRCLLSELAVGEGLAPPAVNLTAIMIIGWRNQSRIRLISLPNDKFGSE